MLEDVKVVFKDDDKSSPVAAPAAVSSITATNVKMYMDQVMNLPKTNELGSSIIKDNLEFEPLKISLYELMMRQLVDDGLVEVAQLLHMKTRVSIPIHMQKNSLYNLYKTVTYLPMDIRLGSNENSENNDLLELKSTNYVRRIESILPHLDNLTKKWTPIRPRSRFLYLYRKNIVLNRLWGVDQLSKDNTGMGVAEERIGGSRSDTLEGENQERCDNRGKGTDLKREFYYLENLSKLKVMGSWNTLPSLSAKLRGNSTISNHRPYCRALVASPNGTFIATGGADGIVKIVPSPLSSGTSVSQTISGSINLSGFGINTNINASSQQKTFTESKGIVTALAYRMHRDVLISGDTDSSIIIYDVKGITSGPNNSCGIGDGEDLTQGQKGGVQASEMGSLTNRALSRRPIQRIRESSPINCIEMHPLDEHFYVGTKDPVLRLYDVNTLDCFTSLHPSHQHCSAINGINVSQDGSIVFTCSDDGTIKVWDSVNLACINTIYTAHNNKPVHSLSLSISQRYLLSSGGDGMARLWDLRQGKELVNYYTGLRFSCHSKVSFLLDERYMILTSVDGSNATYSPINKENSSLLTENLKTGTGVNMNCDSTNTSVGRDLGICNNGTDSMASGTGGIKSLPGIELRVNNKTRIFGSNVLNGNCNRKKSCFILDHQINNKSNIGDLLIYNTITGNVVSTVESIHDAPVMNFELLYSSSVLSGLKDCRDNSDRCNDTLHNKYSDFSMVTVSDDGKCRVLDLSYIQNI